MSGRCSFLSAQIYAQQKNYDKAIEMCNLAASQDATVSGAANRMKEKIATVKARNAEINAYNAARAAEKAKKDKEDAFWNAK